MKNIKKDFPIFKHALQPFIFLDNAATTHKPKQVIDAMMHFYAYEYAPVGRSIYAMAEKATEKIIQARAAIAVFINADFHEIIFTKGATESLNFAAFAWGLHHVRSGDEIVLTQMEHHSNLIPWQQVAKSTGAILKFIPVTQAGTLDYTNLDTLITKKTKVVSIIHESNALGTINDLAPIVHQARQVGAKIVLDACQSVPHQRIDVKQLDVDFLAFSGHKLYGPTGIGILYINKNIQDQVPPYQFGGGMVFDADLYTADWVKPPKKYEAGTLPLAQIVGLHAAVEYIKKEIDFTWLANHEAGLIAKAIDGLRSFPDVSLFGPLDQLKKHGHIMSFAIKGMHPHDVAAWLSQEGIMVRSGHYCAQPLAKQLGMDGSLRLSVAAYSDSQDIEAFLMAINRLFIQDPLRK